MVRESGSADPPEIACWQYDKRDPFYINSWDPFHINWWDRENDYHDGIPDWDAVEWAPIPQIFTPTDL